MDAATVDKLIGILESKNIVLAVGVHENYLVGFAGSTADDFKIVASPAESVLARPEAQFMKSYADKDLLGLMTVSKELQDSVSKETTLFGSLALGLRDGLADAKGFGDTRDIEALLELVAEQERALFDMNSFTPAGVVAFLEQGLKIESYGGSNIPDADLDTPRKYAGLGKARECSSLPTGSRTATTPTSCSSISIASARPSTLVPSMWPRWRFRMREETSRSSRRALPSSTRSFALT